MPPKLDVKKTTCRKCNRMVHLMVVAGKTVVTDTELIAVVVMGKGGGPPPHTDTSHAKRLHAELCLTYQSEFERKKAQAALRRGARP